MSERIGDWIQTYVGKRFYPLDPRPEDFCIEDVAHALAHQCRYGGHSLSFYSVAEHCIHLAQVVPVSYAYAALMHDRAEAYLVDVPRPIKKSLGSYYEIEANIERISAPVFGVKYPNPEIVMEFDVRMLMHERAQLFRHEIPWGTDTEPLDLQVQGWTPAVAEQKFLEAYHWMRIS